MNSKLLSGVTLEGEPSYIYLEHPDVHSSAKKTLTEGHDFDMDRKIPSFVKTEISEGVHKYSEIHSSSSSYPSIIKQEHSHMGMFHAVDFKPLKQELEDTLCEDTSHGFSKVLNTSSNNFQEITGNCNIEPETSKSGCKVSFKMINGNQISENGSSVVEITENSSLINENLQFNDKEPVVKQEQFSGQCNDFTVDICSGDPQKTSHMTDGCDVSVSLVMNKNGVENSYKCDVCGACFTSSSNLKSHKRTHTGEKPYKCDVCGASFTESGNMKRHKRTHTGEKPYKCDECGAFFTESDSLKNHKRTHTGEKPYRCDVCGASFARSGHLKSHERTHTREKPFKCDFCGGAFAESGHLIRHNRTHTGEKPYRCDVCGASFTRYGYLKSHKRTHKGETLYKCDEHTVSFAESGTLKHH